MMRNKKWELPFYSFYDLNGMREHLEDMAQRGWILERITNFGWHYRREEPQKLHYTVTYYPKASAFQPRPSEGEQTFQDFCDHGGWELVSANAQIQVFVSRREDPTPITTDPETYLDTVTAMGKRLIPIYSLMVFLGVINLALLFGGASSGLVEVLSTPTTLFASFIWAMLGLYYIVDIVTYFRWKRRARAAAPLGEFVPVKGHAGGMKLLLLAAILSLVLMFLTDRKPGFRLIMAMMLLGMVVLVLLVNGTRILMQKKNVRTGVNRTVTLLVDFVLAFAIVGGITWISVKTDLKDVFYRPDYYQVELTVEELLGQEEDPAYMRPMSNGSTIFLTRKEVDQMTRSVADMVEKPWLRYELVEVHMPWLYDACVRDMLGAYDEYGIHDEERGGEELYYVYKPVDPAPWGAETAYLLYAYGESRDTYLLCKGNKILEIELDWEPTQDQMALVGERLLGE